ncbi:hypothetical protein N7495_009285 [Penicillium taxi]|uniref:uncharacterized protein n=1 Tax=Penicillium taxi TaxID=168475 RepID=UPI002545A6EA|nr:uncharacterized protein N7495_009285 [Penicillium taxi]KAJ5884775.1 hypothetical protein N7495_009285 [Penicillium taxi]
MAEIQTQAENAAKSSTPVEIYGYESREPSIAERPKVFRRFSRALENATDDFSADPLVIRNKRTSALFFDDSVPIVRPRTTGGPGHRPRPVSMASFQPPFVPSISPAPEKNFSRHFTRPFSVFGRKSSASASTLPPNLISSTNQYEGQGNFI